MENDRPAGASVPPKGLSIPPNADNLATTAVAAKANSQAVVEGWAATGYHLTSREREVLLWLSLGKSGPEVAIILNISVCTVRIHIRNIIRKLNVSNIPHAVARAFRIGLLSN